MSNKRLIYQDMFEDDELGMMPIEIRFLWVGLITAVADDQGRLLDNASLIKSKVFVYDSNVTEELISKWLKTLQVAEMIVRYKRGNKSLIQITNWWQYQTPSWASESKYPAPSTWVDRVKVHTKGNQVKTINWEIQGGFPNGVPTSVGTGVDSNDVKGDCEGEGEGDCDCEVEASAAADPQNVFTVYQNEIGNITPFIAEKLKADIDDFTEGWVIDALKVASAKQARNLPYVEAILKRWKTEGKDAGKRKTRAEPAGTSGNDAILEEVMNGKF